ncbi:hypothetical protein PMAYCL1PPCAC_27478, partial [Pristionchus mayeri]
QSSIAPPRESPLVNQMSFIENRPTGEESLPSLSSPFPSIDADSEETDAFSQAIANLTLEDSQQTERDTDLPERPNWDSLPWPPLSRIFSNLYSHGECFDLAN